MKKLIPYFIIVVLTYFAIKPLLMPGFYTMHDDEQIARLYDLDQALRSGNFPPRIAPNLGFGYGYPFFNFYPSFAYYVGEVFHLLGFTFIDSTKLMLITGFILAAFFMYILVKNLMDKSSAVVAAIAYTYSSYHAVDVYVRGAFAEFFAFVFIPLIFWSIYKLKNSGNLLFVIVGSLAFACLILSHNLITIMAAPFFIIWIFFILNLSKNKLRFLLLSGMQILLGFGLSSYFWLPSYLERGYTLVNILTQELADYNIHFVCVHQLWSSSWGYGGSIPGCLDGLSFEIGKIQLILSFAAFFLACYFLIKKKQKELSLIILIFITFLCIGSFLMVKYSKIFWDMIPPFWYIQFPWRFLILTSFTTAVLSGSIIYFAKDLRLKILLSAAFIAFLILPNLPRFSPEKQLNVTDDYYINKEKIRWYTSSLAYEYVPKGIATKKSALNTTLIDISKDQIASSASTIISGKMQIKTNLNLPQNKKFEAEVITPGILQINTYSFPGWTIFVDNSMVIYHDNNKLKLIQINLANGHHVIEAKFLDTKARTTGNIISILSIILLMGLTVKISLKKYAKAS